MAALAQVHEIRLWENPRVTGRIAEIDGLRGLAILMVLWYHYVTSIGAPQHELWTIVTAGTRLSWSGVDLFFVLSGFLISGILLDSSTSPHYFTTFYARRIHRILPLYFGWLALFFFGIWLQLDGRLGVQLFQSQAPWWLYPLFLQNNAPLWLNVTLPFWMAMSWSLAIEEQFYAVLPGIIRFASKKTLACMCGTVILLSPLYRYLLVAGRPNLNAGWCFATLSRIDGLAMGVAVALLVRNEHGWTWLKGHPRTIRSSAALLFLIFVILTYAGTDLLMALYGFTAISGLFAVLLVCAISQPALMLAGFLRAGVLRYLGKVSYSLYIVHQGAHSLVDRCVPYIHSSSNAVRVVIVTAFSLFVTMLMAELSWRFVESKLIKSAHRRFTY